MVTWVEFPGHCLFRIWWYSAHSNLILLWDAEGLSSMRLLDIAQPVTINTTGLMRMAGWLDADTRRYKKTRSAEESTIEITKLSQGI